jgi:hypothetical protein
MVTHFQQEVNTKKFTSLFVSHVSLCTSIRSCYISFNNSHRDAQRKFCHWFNNNRTPSLSKKRTQYFLNKPDLHGKLRATGGTTARADNQRIYMSAVLRDTLELGHLAIKNLSDYC